MFAMRALTRDPGEGGAEGATRHRTFDGADDTHHDQSQHEGEDQSRGQQGGSHDQS